MLLLLSLNAVSRCYVVVTFIILYLPIFCCQSSTDLDSWRCFVVSQTPRCLQQIPNLHGIARGFLPYQGGEFFMMTCTELDCGMVKKKKENSSSKLMFLYVFGRVFPVIGDGQLSARKGPCPCPTIFPPSYTSAVKMKPSFIAQKYPWCSREIISVIRSSCHNAADRC